MIVRKDWDSEFFGLNIGWSDLTSDLSGAVDFDLVYFELPPEVPFASGVLSGVSLTTSRVVLDKGLDDIEMPVVSHCVKTVREKTGGLMELAHQSGARSRFFLDPRLSHKAGAMYDIWVNNYLSDPAAATFVYEENGQMLGIVNCRCRGERGEIGLFAVRDGFRGKGIGHELHRAVERYYLIHGVRRCSVVTQGENVGALRAYAKYGYEVVAKTMIYHWWNSHRRN